MVPPDFTSQRLLRAASAGDAIAEGELVDRYLTRLMAVAATRLPSDLQARIDPDDVVQSACRVFINRVRAGDIVVQERGDLWNQLLSVTLNKIRSSVRKHRRAKRSAAAEVVLPADHFMSREPTPDEAMQLVETIHEILAELPKESQRRVVRLRLQGNSTTEIASTTGFSVERVRQIIRWVRSVLEGKLQSYEETKRDP